ncbi:MAG: triacylglycerol lipase [Corynebacterium sp.]|uniref:esterase/lipase family protein n=1 Tax=Corynebacterium sp. TaxID=1720 RepID=UPI0026DDA6F8|nr:alpha/beta fold hydrolase [Corynebacterium sp.]MDO5030628.1 triacylglycerol lipase [Corynebacterium sp.]
MARIFPPIATRPTRPNPPNPSDPVPVIALHGTLDSPGAWAPLIDGLRARGRLAYAPAYGERGTGAVGDSVAEVEAHIDRICADTGSDAVDLVAHSQGGLIAFLLYTDLVGMRLTDRADSQPAARQVTLRRVICVSGSVGGIHLSGIARALTWWNGALARYLMGQALVDQIAVTNGEYPLPGYTPILRDRPTKAASPDWINVISHNDRLVIPWSDTAQHFLPDSRTILIETELGGRSVAHWKQQTDPGVVALLTRLLT